ncbi:MAG: trigger factor [Candidatus Nanosynbacter sp. HMT-348_TM7c-JB]|jgi:trigger factor|nr:MAG: trigger factor [Candidatus Nanosynbacter sp. HMT-348_TM7c-JB]
MKTSVKYLSDTKVAVNVTLGVSELKDAELAALNELGKDIKVPGFRKGKVPVSVVSKNVNPNMLAQKTLESALSKAVADAFISEKLQALDRPEVEVKKFVPGSELEFTAESEVMPKIKIGDYKNLKSTAKKVSVTKKDIAEITDRLKKGFSSKKTVQRPAKLTDEVNIDFEGKKDGIAFDGGKGEKYDLVLGSNSFIPGFEDGIIGKKTGETFDLKLTFPEDYHADNLKGAEVVFTTTINEIKEVVEPELNDELAAKAGPFKTVEELEDDIKREITKQKETEAIEKLKDDLVAELVEKSTVPVPDVLLKDQMKLIEQDTNRNLMYRGMSIGDYIKSLKYKDKNDWLENEVRPIAEKRVKAGLLLAELSKAEKIEATENELLEKINQLGKQYPSEDMRKHLKTPEVQRDVANRILTEKTVDRLVSLNSKK